MSKMHQANHVSSFGQDRIAVVIPCFNEEITVRKVKLLLDFRPCCLKLKSM